MATTKSGTALRAKLDLPYETAIEKVTAALKQEGFGILSEIDMKATLKKRLDVDFRKYVILGACNPPFAYGALKADLEAGLLLPCPVIVYEEGAGSVVSIADPVARLGTISNPELATIARDVLARLQRVVASLT